MIIETRDLTLIQATQLLWEHKEMGFEAHFKGRGNGEVVIEVENEN